jgi:predicted RNA-binding protein YlxR (DUF448 family)
VRRGHVALRTCAGCRRRVPKDRLIRVVRSADGGVDFDPTGDASGRGGYVHANPDCVEAALDAGGRWLARALRTSVSQEAAGRLRARLEQPQERI